MPLAQIKTKILNKKNFSPWAEENISFNINMRSELLMVTIADTNVNLKGDSFFDV